MNQRRIRKCRKRKKQGTTASSLEIIQEKEEINDELAKIEAIEIEFVQFVLPWLKLVPPDSCCQDKVYKYTYKLQSFLAKYFFKQFCVCGLFVKQRKKEVTAFIACKIKVTRKIRFD